MHFRGRREVGRWQSRWGVIIRATLLGRIRENGRQRSSLWLSPVSQRALVPFGYTLARRTKNPENRLFRPDGGISRRYCLVV